MTVQDMRFLEFLRNTYGEGRFTSRDLGVRLLRGDLPEHVRYGNGDPARMFGRWLAARVGLTYRSLTLQKLSRGANTQYWKFGSLTEPGDHLMTYLPPSGVESQTAWYWTSIGLWPDEVVK